jgi:hypothetical protein
LGLKQIFYFIKWRYKDNDIFVIGHFYGFFLSKNAKVSE